ncbi:MULTISPECIES: hypothetical protein [unclassified Sphingopyxis]|uniref:hypothetical protein n=1 Tax=unclassified Sphingopyxis TaxID=2614943 RepID=UPI002860125C|nr:MULTISPECIES: hypothetical protein [unclassified Sphingopyxis]MDR7059078.1 hypothetical protein [Sphingopyxis sp. BE235]MDR7178736.1 hypothetical protein [Sphingopyxis sp. BE249]
MSAKGWIADILIECEDARMPICRPIDPGIKLSAVASDLVGFQWDTNGIEADFILPDQPERILRVSFDLPCIVRVLDEMALSTEQDDTPDEGRVADHFAYEITGSRFARLQSETWKEVSGPVAHYQFVTGWACMDVLTKATPQFSFIERKS